MSRDRIALLSNIVPDFIARQLRETYDVYVPKGYNAWISEVLSGEAELYQGDYKAIVLLLDGTEWMSYQREQLIRDDLMLWKQAVNILLERIKNIPVFITTIDIRENNIRTLSENRYASKLGYEWYQFLKTRLAENLYVYELSDQIMEIGRKNFYADKMWYMAGMPYSKIGINAICADIDQMLDSIYLPRKKCILLDLDNTLWGGVIGEDGLDGIELSNHKEGQRFFDFQYRLLEMKKRGILLAVVSKNNETDVEEVFEKHPHMLLKKTDFVSLKINWNDKKENIQEIIDELNLTEGAFIFIDDNPVEREIIKGEFPEIAVPDFPQDTTQLAEFAERIYIRYFRQPKLANEDLNKTEMYLSDIKRKIEKTESLDINEYLKRLEIEIDIHRMRETEIGRVVQLCNKTNQFNLTTKRYSEKDIRDLREAADTDIYVGYMKDKYGDLGLISVMILKNESDMRSNIDTFLMSCRAMGRRFEEVIMNEILNYYHQKTEKITGLYRPTLKNKPVANLYDALGFSCVNENDKEKKYVLYLAKYHYMKVDFYKTININI